MTDFLLALALPAGLFILASGIILLGIYWTHYPYGRHKKRR